MTRPLLMGVLNVTPDSFSDGGLWVDPAAAVAHARELLAQGADIIDVGGESTRPGAGRISVEEERDRALPIVAALVEAGITVSIDTMRAAVASAASELGAAYINDVSGGLADTEMASVAAQSGRDVIVMHWRGHSEDMYARAHYGDVVTDVARELGERVAAFTAAGVAPERIILDPGLGFAKTHLHNWQLIAGLPELLTLGHRVIVGASRKGFLGSVGRSAGDPRPPQERDVATAVTTAYIGGVGVWALRVHDVRSSVDALDVAEAIEAARAERTR